MGFDKKQKDKLAPAEQQSDPFQEAIDYGIDINTMIDNLKRTPEERIRRHQIAFNTADKLRKASPPN